MGHVGQDVVTEQTFQPSLTRRIAEQACEMTGFDATGALLLRHQTNAVYQLVSAPVVVKVTRPGTHHAAEVVSLVRHLISHGVPTVPLATDVAQPVTVAGCAVTLWRYLPQERPIRTGDIGSPLAALHNAPPPATALPPLRPIPAIKHDITASRILDDAERAALRYRCDELSETTAELNYLFTPTLIHGDPQHGNTLWDPTGQPVLCDWESATVAQPEWDLVTIEIHSRRFGHPTHDYDTFVQRYGYDLRDWSGYQALRDLRELRMITTNARKSDPGSPQAVEVRRRIAALGEQPNGQWTIL